MTSIVDYASLQTSLANWLHRADLTAMIPDFIGIAEGTLSADLDARPMDIRTNLTATAGNAYVTLPSDMLEMKRLILVTDPIYVLRYETPDQLSTDYPSLSIVGKPTVFTVIGSQIQLAATPDTNYTLELTCRQRVPSLTSTNTTNWVITNFPNAYLWAALCAAQPFIQNDARLPLFKQMYSEAIAAINSIDWYSGSSMRVRAR
jgi:hypothetical protein